MGSRSGWATCAFALLLGGCAASPPRWSPDPDRGADHAVVYVSTDCSAVLVAERAALTAAHCVEDAGPMHVRVRRRLIEVTACAVHPRAYGEPRACGAGAGRTDQGHDLAVLTLAEPADVPPVPVQLAAPSLEPDWWRQRPVRLVGWDRRPRIVGPLARRSGDNQIVAMRRAGFVTAPPHRAGFHTVIGDSGGPALLRVGGVERVVGVVRGGPAPGSTSSMYSATFEPENAAWLVDVLPEAFARDLDEVEEDRPFGRPHPLWVR